MGSLAEARSSGEDRGRVDGEHGMSIIMYKVRIAVTYISANIFVM